MIFSKFPESSKKYWKLTGDLLKPFRKDRNPNNTIKNIKMTEQTKRRLICFWPHWPLLAPLLAPIGPG